MSKNLFALPEHITIGVLTEWLPLQSLPGLDVAQCSSVSRPSYLTALGSRGAIFENFECAHDKSVETLISWLTKRSVKVRSFSLPNDVDGYTAAKFLRVVSRSLERLTLHSMSPASPTFWSNPDLQFTRLRRLCVYGCDACTTAVLRAMLTKCAGTLEILSLCECQEMRTLALPCPLPKLHTLVFSNSHSRGDMIRVECDLIRQCPNLTRLFANYANKNDKLLHTLAESCPHLEHLHYGFCESFHASGSIVPLIAVLTSCRQLCTLEFTTSLTLTDQEISAIAAHCGNLTNFRVSAIMQRSLAVLLTKMHSLQHLAVRFLMCYGASAMDGLREHCRQLKSLSLHCAHGRVPTHAVAAVFKNLASVEEVSWGSDDPGWVTDELLLTIAQHCKRLRLLSFAQDPDRARHTTGGVTSLVEGCPLLRDVFVSSKERIPVAVRAAHPAVAFREYFTHSCGFWSASENERLSYYF